MTIRTMAIRGIDRREFGVVHREILSMNSSKLCALAD